MSGRLLSLLAIETATRQGWAMARYVEVYRPDILLSAMPSEMCGKGMNEKDLGRGELHSAAGSSCRSSRAEKEKAETRRAKARKGKEEAKEKRRENKGDQETVLRRSRSQF